MPKDAKGHGSNPRGARETSKRLKLGASKGGLTLAERYQATMDKRNKTGAYADNKQAANALASGPKSAPAPVHDAMSETPRVVVDKSVKGATHALVKSDGTVVGRLYKNGSPAWR